MKTVEEKILSLIEEITDETVGSTDTDLFRGGTLDSFKVIELISELEDIFDIDIDAKYVTEENFCTARAITELIVRITGK